MSAASPEPPIFITVKEFAALLRMSRTTLDRMRRKRPKGFPTEYEIGMSDSKHGRTPRYKRDEVLAWMETRALW